MEDISRLLGTRYPIIQGGMAWIADSGLAAAVSAGGGLGLIAAGNADAEYVRGEVRRTKSLTDKPFGVNVMLMSPHAEAVIEMLIEERPAVVATGAGNPGKYIEALKSAGIKIMPVVASVALALRLAKKGVDAVIAEGQEAGGHIGELTTMALVPQVADALAETGVPVIAAGGVADGRGAAAAFMLGARGVQIGTRFLVADECAISDAYKEMILKAKDSDTTVTGRSTGHPVRVLKNRLTKEILAAEADGLDPVAFEERMAGTLRAAVKDGDVVHGSVMAGQVAGLVRKRQKAAEIMAEIMREAREIYENRAVVCGAGRAVPRDGEGTV